MAKKLNVSEIVREYLLFKSVFGNEKVQNYKTQLRLNGNEAKHNLISIYERYLAEMGRIEVPSLANPKVLVSLDVYLNDLEKTYKATKKDGKDLIKPDKYVEFGNQVENMIASVPSAHSTLFKAFEDANYSEIARRLRLGVGKAGGKQIVSVANEVLTVAGMSGKNTYISSLKRQIENLENQLQKAQYEGGITGYFSAEITKLRLEMNKEYENQANLVRAIASSSGKRLKKIELTLTGISDTVNENNSILKKMVRFRPVRNVLLILLTAFSAANLTFEIIDYINDKNPAIVENGGYKEFLDQINMAIADGKMSAEEITDLKNFIQINITDVNEQKQYNNMVDSLAESTKLQGIKTNIVELAKAFGIAEEEGLSESELEEKIANDDIFRAKVIANVSNYAKYADYDEIQNVVTSVGDKLGIAQKAENESNNEFKNRVLEAIGGIQTENAALSKENDVLKDERDMLKDLYNAEVENVKAMGKEIGDLKVVISNLNEKISGLEEQIQSAIAGAGDKQLIETLRSQLSEAQAGKLAAEKALVEKEAELDNEIAKLEKANSDLNQQIKEKDGKIAELENQVKALEAQLKTSVSQDKVDELNAKIDELNKAIIDLENENKVLEEARDKAENALETAKKENADKDAQIADLQSQIASKDAQIKDLNEALANATTQEEVDALNAAIKQLKAEKETLENDLRKANKENEELRYELEESKKLIESLKNEINDLENETVSKETYDRLISEYNKIETLYQGLNEAYKQKDAELEALKKKYQGAVTAEEAQALQERINKLESELEELTQVMYPMYEDIINLGKALGVSGTPEEILDEIYKAIGISNSGGSSGSSENIKQPGQD